MIVRRRAYVALTLGLCACSIDDRQLRLATGDGGMSGALTVGASGAGGGALAGAGGRAFAGAAGSASPINGLVDGCADLDTDGIADCNTTLVESPSFTSDVVGWTPTEGANLTWDPKNALEDLPSGSAKLSASTPRARAFQCAAISGELLVIVYASAFVEPAGAADDPAQAELEVWFFESDDCSGPSFGYFETPPSAVMGEWTTIHAGGLSKATTSSVSITLLGIKPASASELNVYFDNVMLKAKAL